MGRGADPSITNKNGDSGISLSAIKNLSKILKFFYETNPKWLDYEHETNKSNLAFLAVKHFSYEVLELLMELLCYHWKWNVSMILSTHTVTCYVIGRFTKYLTRYIFIYVHR